MIKMFKYKIKLHNGLKKIKIKSLLIMISISIEEYINQQIVLISNFKDFKRKKLVNQIHI